MMHAKFNQFNSIKRTQNQQVKVPLCFESLSPFETADRRDHNDPIFNIKLPSTEELATSKAGKGSATNSECINCGNQGHEPKLCDHDINLEYYIGILDKNLDSESHDSKLELLKDF